MSKQNITVTIDAYQDNVTELWHGYAAIGNEVQVYSVPAVYKETAIKRARRAFFTAISCHHIMRYSHEGHMQDEIGNDYKVDVFKCAICGFIEEFEKVGEL